MLCIYYFMGSFYTVFNEHVIPYGIILMPKSQESKRRKTAMK